jgi:uncharacterized Zn-finger protein
MLALTFKWLKSGNLKTHVASVHEGQLFKSLTCGASFTQCGSLKTHIEAIHEGQKIFKCDIIYDAGFIQSEKMKRHIVTVHEGRTSFKCSFCDANFTLRESMNKHFVSFNKIQIRSVRNNSHLLYKKNKIRLLKSKQISGLIYSFFIFRKK